jgi:spermidine/putrescine transport system permease protein
MEPVDTRVTHVERSRLPTLRSRQSSRLRRPGALGLAAPAAGAMLVFLVAPVVVLLAYSVLTAGFFTVATPLTLENYTDSLSNDLTWRLGRNAFIVGALVAVICVVVALPVAHWLRYSAGRLQMPVLFLITTAMFASYLVRIYAWRSILGERGVLNSGLAQLGIADEPLSIFLFNRLAIVIALVHIALPYVILVLYASFRPLDARYLEAAQDLGTGVIGRWRRVILPLMAVPIVSVLLFVFVLAAADYVTPQFLGGPGDAMVGVQIATEFTASGDWAAGAALSALLLIVFAACFAVSALGLRLFGLTNIRWST